MDLSSVWFLHEPLKNYLKEGINFVLYCYGRSKVKTLNDARKKMAKHSIAKSKQDAPKLESLPPTEKSFFQDLKWRHSQIAVGRCSWNADPPTVDIYLYVWENDDKTNYFIPLPVAPNVCLVPEDIMKVFRCTCTLINSLKSGNCPCNKSCLSCSKFYECEEVSSAWNCLGKEKFNEIVTIKIHFLYIYIEVEWLSCVFVRGLLFCSRTSWRDF